MHTHNTLDLGLRCVSEPLGLSGEDVVLMFSPLGHQTGYLLGMCMPLRYGMKFVLQDLWEPDIMLRLVAEEGVTWTMGATTFVLDACAAVDRAGGSVDLPTFRYFSCGGAPIPPRAVQLARDKLGTQLVAVWGMTEIGIATTTLPSDIDGAKAMSSDGVAADWVQLRIADDAGSPLPAGTEGRLLVRTPTQHRTYFGRHDLYEANFQHGWFDTGDIARMDDDGYIRITGRSKDIIIRGGENIPVTEVEAALYRCPQIREVAVVGYPDDRLGERACAVVVPARRRDRRTRRSHPAPPDRTHGQAVLAGATRTPRRPPQNRFRQDPEVRTTPRSRRSSVVTVDPMRARDARRRTSRCRGDSNQRVRLKQSCRVIATA